MWAVLLIVTAIIAQDNLVAVPVTWVGSEVERITSGFWDVITTPAAARMVVWAVTGLLILSLQEPDRPVEVPWHR